MSDLTLSLKIDLSKFNGSLDEAKKALLGVEGTHNVNIVTDPKNALDGLSKIGNALTGLWASVQMVKGAWNSTVGSWISNAQDSVRAYKLVEQGIVATGGAAKLSADELSGMAEELMKMSNYDDDEIMEKLTSPLLTFRNIVGPTFKEAQERALDLSTVLHQDLQSSALQLGKALNDPIQGVTALRRVGVQLSDQQEAQVKSFMAVNDIASAQRVILDELANQVGGQAKATADPIKQMAVAFGNVGEALGKVLLPYVNQFARYMVDVVVPFIKNDFIPAVKGIVEFFKEWGGTITFVLVPALTAYIIKSGLAALQTYSLGGAFAALNTVIKANGIILIAASVGYLVSQLKAARDHTENWTDWLLFMGSVLTNIGLLVFNMSKAVIVSISSIIMYALTPFKQSLFAILESLALAAEGKIREAGKRISSGLYEGILDESNSWMKAMLDAQGAILGDPTYSKVVEFFQSKFKGEWKTTKDIQEEGAREYLEQFKKDIENINNLATAASANTTGKAESKNYQNFRQAKPSGPSDAGFSDINTDLIRQQQQESLELFKDFYDQQDYIEKSSYDLQRQHINQYYEEHRQTWLAMGITEQEIERQRTARLIESSQVFQSVMGSIEAGYNTAIDGITDKSLSLHERWDKVWQSMGKTALKALADIVKQQAVNLAKAIFFHRAESASHTAKETQKTAVTSANSGFRLGILIAESVKEIALAVATSIKYVATQLFKVGSSIMAFFTSTFGPFGIPMAIASTAGAVAAVNALRKGFRTGGWTGSGSDDEEAGVVHKNEIVFESAIAKKYKSAIMNFRSALQSGVNPMNFAGSQLAFTSGNNADMGAYFKSLENKLDVLNRNLVEKDLSVNIQNKIDGKSIVRSMDKQKASMKSRGYNDRSNS